VLQIDHGRLIGGKIWPPKDVNRSHIQCVMMDEAISSNIGKLSDCQRGRVASAGVWQPKGLVTCRLASVAR
jgi:hypothetical protein